MIRKPPGERFCRLWRTLVQKPRRVRCKRYAGYEAVIPFPRPRGTASNRNPSACKVIEPTSLHQHRACRGAP